jgi:nitrile hydratase accessory protein
MRVTRSASICGRIILSAADAARFTALPNLPRDGDEPVFAEPWQAEAFALTVRLHEAGCFSWAEWADTLAAELRSAELRSGEPDDGSRYYDHWLVALERLVTAKQILSAPQLARRKAAWADAYRSTPHGHPVELAPAAVCSKDE